MSDQDPRNDDYRSHHPRWDSNHADTLIATDTVSVDLDPVLGDDGSVILRRTVWSKAYRAKDRHILWMGDVAVIPRSSASRFIKSLVDSFMA